MTDKTAAVCRQGHIATVDVIDAMNRVEREARATVRGGSVFVDPDDPTYVTRQPPAVDKTVQIELWQVRASRRDRLRQL